MLKFLTNLYPQNAPINGVHPRLPVKAEIPIDVKQLKVFRREYFPDGGPVPWLDRDNATEVVNELNRLGKLSHAETTMCLKWISDGYIILEKFFSDDILDKAWAEYESAIANNSIQPEPACQVNGLPGRNLNTHFVVKKIAELLKAKKITRIISMLMGVKCLPFQTITGHNGSQQLEHSDAIHMTTYPMDYLAATWTAFEDIDPQSGPLVYYPGSHRLPHLLSKEVDISVGDFQTRGYLPYHEKYEPQIQKLIGDNRLEPKYFIAKKGDVLIWHSNLIHGGSPRKNWDLSRKALVCHYFAEGCICYHDLAASLAHIHTK